jgi:23S rRNA U2552 (ribose-2'-O)-methylase RlmE/FtsJ
MVKKNVFNYTPCGNSIIDNDNDNINTSMKHTQVFNEHIHKFLTQHKDHISEQYANKKWDKYKKFANDYELVFTSCYGFPSISSYTSISRSFFKLWEILHDFESILAFKAQNGQSMRGCFLAEGPGGFMEAFCKYRDVKATSIVKDTLFGITLLSQDRNIPNWKLPQSIHTSNNIHLLDGIDGTGSLYSINNLDNYVDTIGHASCNIVTADGGFDFSNDFNNQEEQSMFLIMCEIYMALRTQALDGVFVLKIYDIRTLNTMRIIKVLHENYKNLHIVKPLSSRPANSEKYIVCTSFLCHTKPETLQMFRDIIEHNNVGLLSSIDIPVWFVRETVQYNVYYITRQVIQINRTLALIQSPNYRKNDLFFIQNLKNQLRKAIKWCNKYNINTSIDALHKYNEYYFLNTGKEVA